ncbi:MAG: ABC transporter ATP-binding protein [Pirellulales bacterium]
MTATETRTLGHAFAAKLEGVTKSYPDFQLLPIDLELEQGAVMGLIGPNGAGKSTIMRILMGLLRPDQGNVTVLGQPISSHQAKAKLEIGYFADDIRLYKPESIGWHMQFVRSMYPTWDDAYAQELLHRFGLVERQAIRSLSQGTRVKATLLLILARRPKLLILDEPTNGLDPVAKHEILTELMRVVEDEGRTILYSSHNTQDVEMISDSITFIDRGRVIATDNRDAFLDRWRRIKLRVSETWKFPELEGGRIDTAFRNMRIVSCDRFNESMIGALKDSGAEIEAVEPMNLEEIFVSTVMRGREEKAS